MAEHLQECELSHCARLMAHTGSAKLSWQATQQAGEGGGDHTGDAEPGTGLGWAGGACPAWAPLRPVLVEPTALSPSGADGVNIACDPATVLAGEPSKKGGR